MGETRCIHCGYNRFYKTTIISCSTIPPFFKCVKCNRSQPGKINTRLVNIDQLVVHDRDDNFMTHPVCYICEKELPDESTVPLGWETKGVMKLDPAGNSMYRTYLSCEECKEVRENE